MIGASSGGSGFFLIIIVAFLVLWLIVVRPQRKRQTQQQQMLSDLRVGDEVLTAGGIYGTVSKLDEDQVTVEIAPKTEVRVARRAIAGITREPEAEEDGEDGEGDEPEDGGQERWRSAFDDEDRDDSKESGASEEKKRG
ncbi:MAG TPA: preprotein translocase subunit YajC [Gaiellaceae bacterium]